MRTHERAPVVVRTGEQVQRTEQLAVCRRLWETDAFYDSEGTIFFVTYHPVTKERLARGGFISIESGKPTGVIYDASRDAVERRINQVNGGVETAVAAMSHIIRGIMQSRQEYTIRVRSGELLSLFETDFGTLSDRDFQEAQRQTRLLLREAGLVPTAVMDSETRQLARWLDQGSAGRDSLKRKNKLIATQALTAALARVADRKNPSVPMGKYIKMRSAFLAEQEISLSIWHGLRYRFRPSNMPSHPLFRDFEKEPKDRGIVKGILVHHRDQLNKLHLKPYRPVAIALIPLFDRVISLLREDDRKTIREEALFDQIWDIIKPRDTISQNRIAA